MTQWLLGKVVDILKWARFAFCGWFNKKILSYPYRNPHCRDKVILLSYYLHNVISYTGMTTSSYWIRTQVLCFHMSCQAMIDSLRLRWNRLRFADDIFKWIFLNENVWISIKISLKFVPLGPINNIPALVQIMAWHWSGNKPLSEPLMNNLLTHICITRLQWVKTCHITCILDCSMKNSTALIMKTCHLQGKFL